MTATLRAKANFQVDHVDYFYFFSSYFKFGKKSLARVNSIAINGRFYHFINN